MMLQRRRLAINGWFALDKPYGITSSQSVTRVRALFEAKKAGHAGTLDPLATGVLPIGLGEATKTMRFVTDGKKTYRFTVTFGEARDTDDLEGKVVETNTFRPSNEAIKKMLPTFTGLISQVPPIYSAIKINGEPYYRRARRGLLVPPKERLVTVNRFEFIQRLDSDRVVFEVDCGKGTYIRSLARDLGKSLGAVSYLSELRRTRCGPFCEKDAISLDMLGQTVLCAPPQECLLPVSVVLADIPALVLTEKQAYLLRQGRTVSARSQHAYFVNKAELEVLCDGDLLCAIFAKTPVAIARLEGSEIKPVRVFNL